MACLLRVGCSSISIDSDYDPSPDFASLRTWSWLHDGAPEGVDDLTDGRVRAAGEAVLPTRGLRQAAAGEDADLRVAYHARVQQRIESVPVAAPSMSYRWRTDYVPYDAQQLTTYDEGTLILDLVDAQRESLVWRGTATAIVGDSSSPEKREKRIREAVEKLLERYPPGD